MKITWIQWSTWDTGRGATCSQKQVRSLVVRAGHCCCCCWVDSVVSDSVPPHRQQPTRLPRPWDSQGCLENSESLLLWRQCHTKYFMGLIALWFLFPKVKNLSAMQDTQVWPLGREDSLEKGMATHSSILAWRISWTEELGRLQSMGLQSWTWLSD